MPYDAVIFDLDGVLVRGHQTAQSIYDRAAAEAAAAFDHADDEALIAALADPDPTDAVRSACRKRDLPTETVWRHREERASVHENEQLRTGGREPYDDTATLHELAANAAVGIVSNNRQATVAFVREHFAFGDAVGTAYGRAPTLTGYERMKPDPHYVRQALADLETTNALYVGDRASDITTAHNAALDAALLRREHNGDVQPDREPTHVIDGLDELPALV
jgi:HAD superfamily hydrolase (TIGR01549 family)